MRKLMNVGIAATLALGVISGGVFAQDTQTDTDTETVVSASAWLGIAVVENDGQVTVARVALQSPAVEALEIGDVIVAFDGTEVASAAELSELVLAAQPGDEVTLDVLRDGEAVSVDVTLGSAPQRGFGRGMGPMYQLGTPLDMSSHLFGAELEETNSGYEVIEVLSPRNPFELVIGDIVTSVNGQDVTTLDLETLHEELEAMETPQLSIIVERDGEEITLTAPGLGLGGERGFGGGGHGPMGPGHHDGQMGPMGPGHHDGQMGPQGGQNGGGRGPMNGGQNGQNGVPQTDAPAANGAAI